MLYRGFTAEARRKRRGLEVAKEGEDADERETEWKLPG
jgi:hypothetical protein